MSVPEPTRRWWHGPAWYVTFALGLTLVATVFGVAANIGGRPTHSLSELIDQAQLFLGAGQFTVAVVLAGLSSYYAVQNRQILGEMRAARTQEAEREQKQGQLRVARRQVNALRAARRALRPGPEASTYAQLDRDIELDAFELEDNDLRERLEALRLVAFTLSWGETSFGSSVSTTRPTTWGVASLRFSSMLTATIGSLERFITGNPLPAWDDYPSSNEAQAWILTGPDDS